MKCDRCDNPATVHLIEIIDHKKVEKHLCELHAMEEGVSVQVTPQPINELLEKFVLKHGGEAELPQQTLQCDNCNLTYQQFRKNGLLGCPQCYTAFESALVPLLARAHEGAKRHLGKVPVHAGDDQLRQQRLLQLRRELEDAVAGEQYEQAASLRDQLSSVESQKK